LSPLPTGTGLLVAAVVPVAVIGWSIIFSVEAARRGPAWSLRHLEIMGRILRPALALGIVAILVVRPVWVGLSVVYPIAVALLMAAGRRRQLAAIERGGFGEVQPATRDRMLARLRPGLILVGAASLLLGIFLAAIGVFQGWVLAALAPITGVALLRSKSDQVGSVVSR
jgi:hypothetical protein